MFLADRHETPCKSECLPWKYDTESAKTQERNATPRIELGQIQQQNKKVSMLDQGTKLCKLGSTFRRIQI